MGSVFRKLGTKRLPEGARIFTRGGKLLAEWESRGGKKRSGEVREKANGDRTVLVRSPFYFAKYRDGQGLVRTISSGCRDASAAQAMLAKVLRQEEQARAGLITASERSTGADQRRPIEEHIEAFRIHLETKGRARRYVRLTAARLKAVAKEAGLRTLADATGERLEAWLRSRIDSGIGAASHAAYRAAWSAFGNWLARNRKLPDNPARYLPSPGVSSEPRRERRALTDSELVRLLDASPEPRAIVYRVMASTGLRANESGSIVVGDAALTGEEPYLSLRAGDAKNRSAARIPLPRDVASAGSLP